MLKMELRNGRNQLLGIGYCDEYETDKIEELRRQIRNSGIRAELTITHTDTMEMNELGEAMREHQENVDRIEEMGNMLEQIPIFDF